VREAPADCAFLGTVASVAVLRAHGAGAAHSPGAVQGIMTLGTGFLTPSVGREVEAIAALAAGGCGAALRALVGAGLTDSTNVTSPVRIVAWRAGRLAGLVVREERREFALRAVVFRLALVARRRADLANAAQIVDTLLIVAILTLLFAPVVVRQVSGVAALLAHCRAGAQTAVLGTEWAGVAHATPDWQLPVAIWANVATHTIWVEELVVLARRANLVGVTGVAVAGTRLAGDVDLADTERIQARWASVFAGAEGREEGRVFALRALIGGVALIARCRALHTGAASVHSLIRDVLIPAHRTGRLAGTARRVQEVVVLAHFTHESTGTLHAVVGAKLAETSHLFRPMLIVARWALIVAFGVRCEIRRVLALLADVGGIALVAGVEATRTNPARLLLAIAVEAIRTLCLASAVRVQIARFGALQADIWTCANSAVAHGAAFARSATILRTLRIVAVRAGHDTVVHVIQMH